MWRRLWIRLYKFKQRAKTLSPEITFNGVGSCFRLIVTFRLLLLGLWRGILLSWFWGLQRLWPIGYPDQSFRVIFFQIFSPLGVFPWRGRPFLICLMHWDVFIEYIKTLFAGGEFDRQDPFAVVYGLGSSLACPGQYDAYLILASSLLTKLGAFAIGCAVLIQQRVVAVVGEAEAVIFTTIPAVMEAVSVSVRPLYRVYTALRYGSLLLHLLFRVRRVRQCLLYRHAPHIRSVLFIGGRGASIHAGRGRKRGKGEGDGGVRH